MPFLQPTPQVLDAVPVDVNPIWAGYSGLVALRRDRRLRAQAPDVLTKAVAGVAAVGYHPLGYARQLVKQRHGLRQLVRLTGCECKGDGSSATIGNHARLGAVAAPGAAERLTLISLLAVSPLFSAPAALW